MQMEIFMKDNGKMIKLMVTELTNTLMAQLTLENGKMINSMEEDLKHGQMEPSMKGYILMVRNMERVH